MRWTLKALSLTITFTSVLLACSRPAARDEVVGTYAMNAGKAHDTLVIYSNGVYVRRYTSPGALTVTDSGRWTWDKVGEEERLSFEKFIPRWHDEPSRRVPKVPGFWSAKPERNWRGEITVLVERDLGWAYVRLKG